MDPASDDLPHIEASRRVFATYVHFRVLDDYREFCVGMARRPFQTRFNRPLERVISASVDATGRALRAYEELEPQFTTAGIPKMKRRVLFVSDSVFVACWPDPHSPHDAARAAVAAIMMAGLMCHTVMLTTLMLENPTLVYRGVVTAGEFAIHDDHNFLVGPAVDEVASLERDADGAFVWLTDRARATVFDGGQQEDDAEKIFQHHDVPMKDGRSVATVVVDPVTGQQPESQRLLLRNMFLPLPPEVPESVRLKRRNTAAYYRRMYPALLDELGDELDLGA
jgi:hypothetical protein